MHCSSSNPLHLCFRASGLCPLALLLMACCASLPAAEPERTYSWRGMNGTGVFPATGLVTEFYEIADGYPHRKAVLKDIKSGSNASGKYRELHSMAGGFKGGERKNIVWRVPLPSWGYNTPVAVGDRVFLLCEDGPESDAPELLCLSAIDGTLRWRAPVDHLDAWPEAKAKEAKQARAIELKRWADHMAWWNRFYWDNEQDTTSKLTAEAWAQLRTQADADGWIFPDFKGKDARVRGRFGRSLKDMGGGGEPKDKTLVKNGESVGKQGIYYRQGWTTANAWYGNTFGSVVSDGRWIYATTALGAAAAFDLNGKRLWITDMDVKPRKGCVGSDAFYHMHMVSPVLAGGHLIFFHRDGQFMLGLDVSSGKIAWRTLVPGHIPSKRPGFYELNGKKTGLPPGYKDHMAPQGTPVVLQLPTDTGTMETVAVTAHGWVVRVRDGKSLGLVVSTAGTVNPTYGSWVGQGDRICVQVKDAKATSISLLRLKIAAEKLQCETLWTQSGGHAEKQNMIIDGNRLLACHITRRGQAAKVALTAFDLMTGKPGRMMAAKPSEYVTAWGLSADQLVARLGTWRRSSKYYNSFGLFEPDSLAARGFGVLVPPKPSSAQIKRHIAFLGQPYQVWGCSSPVPWGNRIYIRSADYLWCIGDPKAGYIPPEQCWE